MVTCEGYDRTPTGWKACSGEAIHVTVNGVMVCCQHVDPWHGRITRQERGRRGGLARAAKALERRKAAE